MSGSRSRVAVGLLSLAAALFAGAVATAQTVALPANSDTYLRQSSANQNNGQDTLLHVQQSGHNRVLVAMDSAAIAAAVGTGHLASATLELYVTDSAGWGTAGRTVDLHRMAATWTENGATWNCGIDTIPTNSQPNCTTQWDGGTFDDEPSDSALHLNTTGGIVQWNVTDDVRAFLSGTPNYGWLAKLSDETLGGNVDYTSRQGSATAQRPRLVLVVESPAFDQVPPSISISTPAHPFVINDTTPAISVSYADGGSGISTATLDVRVDGTASVCTAGASSATCEPATLAQGTHTISASIRDQAGNAATTAARSFTLLIGPGLRTATFTATADTTLKKSSANQVFGSDPTLRLRQSGKNRSLMRFDAAEIAQTIGQGTLRSASLELSLGVSSGWGKTGRTVDAHRLTADWTEPGATWNCAIDTIPTNGAPNCTTQWAGGTFAAAPSATVLHTNGQTGTVAFDVTADLPAVVAGNPSYGWLVKKNDETKSGKADYASREAGASGAPRLVVLFEVPDGGGDTAPPTIAITAPTAAVIYNDSTPQIRVEYSDVGSGVNLASLRVVVDGVVLSGCQVGASAASCAPSSLAPGAHVVEAEMTDQAGNRASVGFSLAIAQDDDPPSIAIVAPEGTLYNPSAIEVGVTYFDELSGIDPASLAVSIDGVVLAGCARTDSSATCPAGALAAGAHSIRAEIRDRVGNPASAVLEDFKIVVDAEAPIVTITSPPSTGSTAGAVADFEVAFEDAGSGVAIATFRATLDGVALSTCATSLDGATCSLSGLASGSHSIAAEISDQAGNRGSASRSFSVAQERVAPFLRIVAPTGAPIEGIRIPAIELAYGDAQSGIDPASLHVTLDDLDVTSTCQADLVAAHCGAQPVAAGVHTIVAEISDTLGNPARALLDVKTSLTLAITITSPAGGTIVREPTVRLEGTVSPGATSVEVSGVPAELGADSWVLPAMPIREGGNTLTVVARSGLGGVGTATVAVIRDSEAPRVAILTPHDGFVTSASQIVVSGDLVDSVSTSSQQRALKVRVNDHDAVVERKSFVLTDLLLLPGENRIEVTAEDEAGNVGHSAISVRFVPDAVARIEEISGNFQEAAIRDTLEQPLVVRVVDFLGRPLAGRTVDFAVTRGDGSLLSFPDAARHLSATTNEEGLAAMRFALGTRAGAGNQEVTVGSVGIPGSVLFCASARPKPAKQVHPIAATDFQGAKIGPAGQALPKPLFVQVFDGFGNPVAGQEVVFRSVEGGGTFGGAPEMRITTDDEGKAGAVFTLGPDEGINNNRVEVNFDGATDPPARFIISGLVPGPAELTAMAGIVLDPSDAPVPGARIHIGSNETRTDAEGRFRLNGVPVGTVHVEIDGSTVTRPGTWPPLGYELVMISGRVNELGKPMRLPQIDDAGKKRVGGDQDVTIPIHGVAGAMLTVFAHSVTFPDGSHEGDVAFTQVPAQKVPMVAPQNAGFMLAWTIQPAGVHFDPPARVSIPNFGVPGGGGNPPGLTGEIFSFDHDLGEFVSAGTASITEDGMMMMSNPGMGISKTGWGGCPHPPAPPAQGCGPGSCTVCPAGGGPPVSNCGACQVCTGEGCRDRKIDKVTAEGEPIDPDAPGGGSVRQPQDGDGGDQAQEPVYVGEGEPLRLMSDRLQGDCSAGQIKAAWSFGDDSENKDGRTVEHTYEEEGERMAEVRLECICPGSLRATAAPVTDSIAIQIVKAMDGFFKMVEMEEKLTLVEKDEDGDGKREHFFRVLGGARLRLELNPPSGLAGQITEYRWRLPTGPDPGVFFDGYGPDANVLAGDNLKGANLRSIYWEAPKLINKDLSVEVFINVKSLDAPLRLRRRIKTRVLTVGIDDGDDIKMLQSQLRLFGFTGGNTPGYAGTPIMVDGTFSAPLTRGVIRIQDADNLPMSGQVRDLTLEHLARHWADFYRAYMAYPNDPTIDKFHGDFEAWVKVAEGDLKHTYSDAANQAVRPGSDNEAARRDLIRAWAREESDQGQWGFHGRNFRITQGSADEYASIGFDQILNKHKYGAASIATIKALNLYHPQDNIRGFVVFSNDSAAMSAGGGGFDRGFIAGDYTKSGHPTDYPRLVHYSDDTKDILSKSIMAYNRGSSDSAALREPWSDMLRNYDPPLANTPFGRRTAMNYALEIERNAGIGLRCFNWMEKVITTGPDDKCDTPRTGADVSVPNLQTGVHDQVCLYAGIQTINLGGGQSRSIANLAATPDPKDHLTTWSYSYCEQEWLGLVNWPTRRQQQLPLMLP
ncbi:MAG: DNRLRE domain-containing protein [Acidobacteriota bacterium]